MVALLLPYISYMFIDYCCCFFDIHDICESHLAFAIWCHPPRQKHSLSSQLQIKHFGRDYVSFTRGGTCSGKECQYFFIGMVIIELNRPPSWWCIKFGGIHINLQGLWLQFFLVKKTTHQLTSIGLAVVDWTIFLSCFVFPKFPLWTFSEINMEVPSAPNEKRAQKHSNCRLHWLIGVVHLPGKKWNHKDEG